MYPGPQAKGSRGHAQATVPQSGGVWRGAEPHLEVVAAVAVRVLGRVQEDQQVLPQVPGQGREPGPAGGREGQMQHF